MKEEVVSPQHYKPNGVFNMEPIEMMYNSMTHDAFVAYCEGCIIKYMHRYHEKNGIEDLKKAKTYLDFIICSEAGYSPLYIINGGMI